MAEVEKEIKKEEKKIKKFFSKKENIWMSVSIVLLVLLIVAIAWPSGISSKKAGEKVIAFAKDRGLEASLINVSKQGTMFEVNIDLQGQTVPVYVTNDGKFLVQGMIPLEVSGDSSDSTDNSDTTPKEVPKSAKPVVNAFVFSYCPYGLQFEKALSPVYTLLKNKADINLVAIGAMHGQHEETESLRQICIQKLYGKDKLWAYLDKFAANTSIGDCNSDTTCSKPLVESIMKKLTIDVAKVNTCMTNDAPELYKADNDKANSLGQTGSPGFMINGVDVQVSRSPEAIKQAICGAFTTAPAECSKNLSTSQASAWFGSDASSAGSSAASCG